MVISSFMRAYHLKDTGECPSGLATNITEAQDNARKALYLAATSDQELPDEILAQMVHALCDSLLCAKIPPEKVFGPVEFAFCLFMRQKDGKYRPVNHLTSFFAGMQWCLRIILTHIIRLQDLGSLQYIPYSHSVAPPTSVTLSISPPPPPAKNLPDIASTMGDQLENAVTDSWLAEEASFEDGLEDSLSDLEDYSRDAEEAPGSESNSPVLAEDKIIPQDSEGLLKWVKSI